MKQNHLSQISWPATKDFQSAPRPAHRILVVDDEPLIRQLNTEILLDAGYQVDVADDGAVAWEALQLYNYDLLVTDNDMPNVSGVGLLQKLHAAQLSVPVIMATGTWPHAELKQQPWLQIEAQLLKPYTMAELLGTVRNVLYACASSPLDSLPYGSPVLATPMLR